MRVYAQPRTPTGTRRTGLLQRLANVVRRVRARASEAVARLRGRN